jgi:hypothetical protein
MEVTHLGLIFFQTVVKIKEILPLCGIGEGKGKGKIHPRTGHESPKGQ